MASCHFWMNTHQKFNEVLSTSTNLSEEYGRSCQKTWKRYELELTDIEKEPESYAGKYAKYAINRQIVETSWVQDEIIYMSNESGVNSNNNNPCVDELLCDSIFIHTNENIIKNQKYFNVKQVGGESININKEIQTKAESNDVLYGSLLVESNLNDNDNASTNSNAFINTKKYNSNNNNNNGNNNNSAHYGAIDDKFEILQLNHNMSNENNDNGIFRNTESCNSVVTSVVDANIDNNGCTNNEINGINVFDNTFYSNVFYDDFVHKSIEQSDETRYFQFLQLYSSNLRYYSSEKLLIRKVVVSLVSISGVEHSLRFHGDTNANVEENENIKNAIIIGNVVILNIFVFLNSTTHDVDDFKDIHYYCFDKLYFFGHLLV